MESAQSQDTSSEQQLGITPNPSGFWPRNTAVEVRFFSKTRLTGAGCLEWTASRTTFGHGQFYYEGRVQRAHRVAWILQTGEPLAPSIVVRHLCDNPPCVNFEHLALGTNSQNISEMHAKGRASFRRKTLYSDETIERARALHEMQASYGEIAARTGIHEDYVWAVVSGQRRTRPQEGPSAFSQRMVAARVTAEENAKWMMEVGDAVIHPSDVIAGEVWRLTNYPRYFVSDLGRVVGPRKRILKPSIRPNGKYLFVTCGRGNVVTVHALVCTAFHGARPEGKEVAHNDGNGHNNRADNLRWATRAENGADMTLHGSHRDRVGEKVPSSKLTADQVRMIRATPPWRGYKAHLAKELGVCRTTIDNVLTGKTWTTLLP